MSNNNFMLNRVFTRNTLLDIINNYPNKSYIAAANKYVESPSKKSNEQVFRELYNRLNLHYRNEYYYKNTLINKLLLGIHSLNTTTALSEIPIAKSKADFILINGKATIYEIKTELDSIYRLKSQINDYYRAFSRVVVVTSESNLPLVKRTLDGTHVGIKVLRKNNKISNIKSEIESFSNIEHQVMFKVLRKKEFEAILTEYFGFLPVTSQFYYYKECFDLFKTIETTAAYNMFVIQLKKRKDIDKNSYANIPYELKSLLYFTSINQCQYKTLNNYLKIKFRG